VLCRTVGGEPVRIAIIGMGNVGSALGRRWSEAGHDVTFCVRDPDDPGKRADAERVKARVGPVSAARDAEAVLLAVPWAAVPDALKAAGDLSGKVLLDCTNPVTPELTHLTIGFTTSSGEEVARLAPKARVVKVFNTNGAKNMADPDYGGHRVTMLYAGDDGANRIAARLAEEIGFEAVYLGPLRKARLLEPLAMAWIVLARHRGLGRDFALNIVRRPMKSE
jgi:predicted dinucleotide-binding enzyme